MIDIRNQKGVTLFALAIIITTIVILTMVPLNLVLHDGGILNQTEKSEIYLNVSAVQERVSSDFLIDNDLDHSVAELMNKGYITKLLNNNNEEIYWITKKGLENLASGYEAHVVDEKVDQKIAEGLIEEIEKDPTKRKIRINSIDDLIGTNIYVIDRNLSVAYIAEQIYGEVEFIKSGTEPENIWWKAQ